MARYQVIDRFKGSTVHLKKEGTSKFESFNIDKATQSQLKALFESGHPAVTEAKPKSD